MEPVVDCFSSTKYSYIFIAVWGIEMYYTMQNKSGVMEWTGCYYSFNKAYLVCWTILCIVRYVAMGCLLTTAYNQKLTLYGGTCLQTSGVWCFF